MKLAEALMLRADLSKKIRRLEDRLLTVTIIQEGDDLPENPEDLFNELEQTSQNFTDMVKKINKTNSTVLFDDGKTLSDALAERDALILRKEVYESLSRSARVDKNRHSRSEVKYVVTVNVHEIQKKIDALSKAYRELDSKIQQFNWAVDLIE